MKMQSAFATRAISIAVGSLGIYVLIGWATGSSAMVRVTPNSVAVSINTAIMFLITAALFSMPLRAPRWSRVSRGFACALLVLACATLFEHLTGIALGIDLPHLHQVANDGSPAPGRPALNTCIGFLFVGTALIGLSKTRSSQLWGAAIVFCTYGTLGLGISGIIGYALDLEFMYRFAIYNRMALPTAIALALLGVDLWLALRTSAKTYGELPVAADIRITQTAIVVLTGVTAVTCLSGFLVLKSGFEEIMLATSLRNATSYAGVFESAIDQQLIVDDIIATRPGIQNGLAELAGAPFAPKTVALLEQIGIGFTAFGLSGFQLYDARENLIVTVGSMVGARAVMNIPLARPGQMAKLMWQDGFVLHNTRSVWKDGRKVGHFIAEQRIYSLTATMRVAAEESASTDVLVCGRELEQALCYPSKFYKANLRIPMYRDGKPYLAISRALLGQRGVLAVRDLRGVQVLAGYAPIGTLGLGLVHKTDSVELYHPVRERLNLFIGMLILLVAMGTFALRAQVQPLAQKLSESESRLAQLVRFDTLTGLPNRFHLNEKLEETANRCRRLGAPLAVMFLDIDHFKQINDTLGHAAGDIVLKEFSARLAACLRATDVAGRLAGDEFVVLIEAPHGLHEPAVVARKILDAMQGVWLVDGQSVQVTTSVGIAFAREEILSADALLAKADSALYQAKSAGRNRFIVEMC